jgi:hypothetical protein
LTSTDTSLSPSDKFSIAFTSAEFQEKYSLKGKHILGLLTAYEIFRYLSPMRKIDHVSHLGGIAVGVVCAHVWKANKAKNGQKFEDEEKSARWHEVILGKK